MSASSVYSAAQANAGPDSSIRNTNSLRILVVDDNHVNLAVLTTLLKRRFSHLLARPPVALDSGLKAMQALRTEVFDLILMDIEMPYLNGVECTRRIRECEDGILRANRDAHIVAVTTNVGDVEGVLYRQVGMNGMISKPARFDQFRQYLCPLSIEAHYAQASVSHLMIDSASVMPPLPPIHLDDRVFFTPVTDNSASKRLSTPQSLSNGSGEFAAMLKAQSAKSLSEHRSMSVARAGSLSLPRRSSFNSPRSEHLPALRTTKLEQNVPAKAGSFELLVDQEADSQDRMTQARKERSLARPGPMHRLSSPAHMLDPTMSYDAPISPVLDSDHSAKLSVPDVSYQRPSIRPLAGRHCCGQSFTDGKFDLRASPSSSWSNTQSSGATTSYDLTDSDTRIDSPSSTATTPLSSPTECGIGWQDMFSKATFSPCADDLALPHTTPTWDEQFVRSASSAGQKMPTAIVDHQTPFDLAPTRPFTAQSA